MDPNQSFYKNVLDNLSEGVCFVDRQGRITYWNASATRITGLSPEEVTGKPCAQSGRQHLDESGCALCDGGCPLMKAITTGQPQTHQLYLRHSDGQRILVESRIQPLSTESGSIIGAIEVFLESASHRGAMNRLAELERMAMHDPLTGIANRRYLDQELASRLEAFRRNGWAFGILMTDIDRFKAINDNCGHMVGDRIIRLVATTLAVNVRPFDLVGRWGGEEFLALVSASDTNSLGQIAERLRILVEMTWLVEGSHKVKMTVSIGGAVVEPDDTTQSLIARADTRLYEAKRAGRNCVRI
jgi:diguanylate cyclase (GGDEF)-like protein/PAS domain S-box-containing protein